MRTKGKIGALCSHDALMLLEMNTTLLISIQTKGYQQTQEEINIDRPLKLCHHRATDFS